MCPHTSRLLYGLNDIRKRFHQREVLKPAALFQAVHLAGGFTSVFGRSPVLANKGN